MSDDPIQAIVDKLDAIEGSVSKLAVKIDTVPSASSYSRPDVVEKAAERGASRVAEQIADNVRSIQTVAYNLERAIVPVQGAVRNACKLPRSKIAVLVLAALLALSVAFIVGLSVARTGLLMSTKIGCKSLGGTWSPRQDTNEFVCWWRTHKFFSPPSDSGGLPRSPER